MPKNVNITCCPRNKYQSEKKYQSDNAGCCHDASELWCICFPPKCADMSSELDINRIRCVVVYTKIFLYVNKICLSDNNYIHIIKLYMDNGKLL